MAEGENTKDTTENQQPPSAEPAPVVVASQVNSESTPLAPAATSIPPKGPDGSISWTASEFVAHHKSAGWYLALAGAATAAAALVWLATKDKISTSVVLIGAAAFGAYGARKPRQLQYSLDQQGLTIAAKYYAYQQFRSFAIVPEGAFNSIVFVPLKRFAPLTTIYYDPADEAKIVDLLSDKMPVEEREKDLIDRLMWRIRF